MSTEVCSKLIDFENSILAATKMRNPQTQVRAIISSTNELNKSITDNRKTRWVVKEKLKHRYDAH
jgi:hypothetical protein